MQLGRSLLLPIMQIVLQCQKLLKSNVKNVGSKNKCRR